MSLDLKRILETGLKQTLKAGYGHFRKLDLKRILETGLKHINDGTLFALVFALDLKRILETGLKRFIDGMQSMYGDA